MGFLRSIGWIFILAGIFLILDFFFFGYLNINAPFLGQPIIGLILIFIGWFFGFLLGRKGPAPLRY